MRRTRWCLFAVVATLAGISARDASAITGVLYNPTNGHYYKLYNTLVTWASAKSNADGLGGYLATVTSSSEDSWLVSNSLGANTPWIGGTDEVTEGTWVWVSGETWSYTNWNAGEPNNSSNEDYTTLRPDGTWNDWNSTGTAYYIVEWNTDPNLPADPANLRATLVSDQRMDLAWDDLSTGETNFELEKAIGSGSFSQLAQPAANTATYSDGAVSAETSYRYRVRAVNAVGTSGWSNTLTVTTAPPSATGLTATAASARSVQLAWTDNSSAETGFEVERGTGSPGQGFANVWTAAPNATSYLDTAVTPDRTYSYRVRVAGAGGTSSYTAEASVSTPLAAPSGVVVQGTTDRAVTLTWNDDSASETGFEIVRGNGCPASIFGPLTITGPNITTFVDETVLPEHSYTYRIRAVKTSGTSDWTVEKCITTPPYAPTDAAATALSANRVHLTWTDVSQVETSYEIARAPSQGGSFELMAVTTANVTEIVDGDAGQESSYVYRVAAVGQNGRSGWAVTGEAATDAALVIRKARVVRPKKAGSPSKLTITGEFDVGGRGVDLGATASFGVGESAIPIGPLTQKGAAFTYAAAGVRVNLKPAVGSSRVAFTLQTDDTLADFPASLGSLTVSYTNAGFRASAIVQFDGDVFLPPRHGMFLEPHSNLVSIAASLKAGANDVLVVKGAFSEPAGTPEDAPEVHVKFGTFDVRVPGAGFTRSADKWSFREHDLGTATSITLDYAKGTIAFSVHGAELGVHAAGSEALRLAVEFGEMHFEDTPLVASTGKSLKY